MNAEARAPKRQRGRRAVISIPSMAVLLTKWRPNHSVEGMRLRRLSDAPRSAGIDRACRDALPDRIASGSGRRQAGPRAFLALFWTAGEGSPWPVKLVRNTSTSLSPPSVCGNGQLATSHWQFSAASTSGAKSLHHSPLRPFGPFSASGRDNLFSAIETEFAPGTMVWNRGTERTSPVVPAVCRERHTVRAGTG
jgi:hypothetical protein